MDLATAHHGAGILKEALRRQWSFSSLHSKYSFDRIKPEAASLLLASRPFRLLSHVLRAVREMLVHTG